nr:4891_t:CDS:2 [Entrophospora candida]
MYTIIKIRSLNFVFLACILIIISINTDYVIAQKDRPTATDKTTAATPLSISSTTSTSSISIPSSTCVVCNEVAKCTTECKSDEKCITTTRTCKACPVARCEPLSSNSLQGGGNNNASSGNSGLVPAVVGSIVGVAILAISGYGYFVLKKRSKLKVGSDRGLDNSATFDEKDTITDSENVIPIAYIPTSSPIITPLSPTSPSLSDSQSYRHSSAGTTPLASPLPNRKFMSGEQILDINDGIDDCDHFRESNDVGTILQATKTLATGSNATFTTSTAATLMTATRVKPALVRINTIKSKGLNDSSTSLPLIKNESSSQASSIRSGSTTPKTPLTCNSFLSSVNSLIPSGPSSPSKSINNGSEMVIPQIDIERSSTESSRTNISNISSNSLNTTCLDPIEGRQSFGLFGSDEVYDDTGPTTPQVLHRESILSATSSNGRSTMLSDEGDGEIMIFWGGDNPTFVDTDRPSSSVTKNNSETRNNSENNNGNNENENDNSDTGPTDN